MNGGNVNLADLTSVGLEIWDTGRVFVNWASRMDAKAKFRVLLEYYKVQRWLKQGRRVKDIDIAKAIGVHPTRLARWQSLDEFEIPGQHQLKLLAQFLSLSEESESELLECLGYNDDETH